MGDAVLAAVPAAPRGRRGQSDLPGETGACHRQARGRQRHAGPAISMARDTAGRFYRARWRPGYQTAEVDEFIARIEVTLTRGARPGPVVTAADVEAAKFGTTRRGGYDEQVVDEALDQYADGLARLAPFPRPRHPRPPKRQAESNKTLAAQTARTCQHPAPGSHHRQPSAGTGNPSRTLLRVGQIGPLTCSTAGAGENLLRRPAAARSIGSYRRKAQRSDVTVTAIPAGGRPGARRPGFRRRAAALVGLPAGHGHRPRRRAGDQQPDVPGVPRAAALRAAGQRVPVRRGGPRRAPDPAAAAAGRPSLPGARARGRARRADGYRDHGRARRRLPVAARRAPRHGRRGGVRALRPGRRAAWRRAGGRAARRRPAGLAHRPALGPAGRPAGRRPVRRAALRRDERRAGGAARCGGPPRRAVVARRRRPARPGHPRRPRAVERAGRPGHGRGDRAARLRARRRRLPGAGHPGRAVQLHGARRAGLAAPHGGLPARLRLGPPPGARRGGGAARAAHRPVARLRPVAGRQVARRARALRRGHSPCRQTGGDHAVARGQRGCVPVRRGRRERG